MKSHFFVIAPDHRVQLFAPLGTYLGIYSITIHTLLLCPELNWILDIVQDCYIRNPSDSEHSLKLKPKYTSLKFGLAGISYKAITHSPDRV